MSHEVRFSPDALDDLLGPRTYVAAEAGATIAAAFIDNIVAYAESLSIFPQRGRRRDDVRPDLRVIGFRRRVSLAFTVRPDVVTILGVFYAGRDLEADLRGDDIGPSSE